MVFVVLREQELGHTLEKVPQHSPKDPLALGPDEQTFVVDEYDVILFSDFSPLKKLETGIKPHLEDIVDSKEQDILRLISVSIARPDQLVTCECAFRTKRVRVRAIHLKSAGEPGRTHVILRPDA